MIQLVNETVIVTALKSGNVRRAVELLLDSYNDEVYSYCARLVGVANSVSVFHRVLAQTIESLATFDNQTSLRAWLYCFAREQVVLHHRQNRGQFPDSLESDYVPVEGPPEEGVEEPQQAIVLAALARVEPATQELLQLSFWHGLHLVEVAHVIQRPVGEVRGMASSGLNMLAYQVRRVNGPLS